MTPIEINYLAVLVCGIAAMVLGFIWFGLLFEKLWMNVCGTSSDDLQKRVEMKKRAAPLYVIQFILALFQAWALAHYFTGWNQTMAVLQTIEFWLIFVMPVVAGMSMWNNDSKKISWTRFLLQGGYYLVLLVVFALILSVWM